MENINSINNIAYEGIVTIDTYLNGKKYKSEVIHNEGGIKLFYYLAQCLLGTYYESNCPKYVKVLKKTSETQFENVSITVIPYSNRYLDKDEDSYSAKYVFLIPGASFKHTINGETAYLGLYSEEDGDLTSIDNYLARINWSTYTAPTESLTDIVYSITWELKIQNKA